MTWGKLWLILHVLGVIIAFGPPFAYPLIAAQARRNPQHGAFAVGVIGTIATRLTVPLALVVLLTGIAMIVTTDMDLLRSEWLLISIGLFAVALSFAVFVQIPTVARLLRALRALPPGPPPAGAGPPPEVGALTRRLRIGGIFLSLSVVVIAVLMIWRPGHSGGLVV